MKKNSAETVYAPHLKKSSLILICQLKPLHKIFVPCKGFEIYIHLSILSSTFEDSFPLANKHIHYI
jgi:hypothetical protein